MVNMIISGLAARLLVVIHCPKSASDITNALRPSALLAGAK